MRLKYLFTIQQCYLIEHLISHLLVVILSSLDLSDLNFMNYHSLHLIKYPRPFKYYWFLASKFIQEDYSILRDI